MDPLEPVDLFLADVLLEEIKSHSKICSAPTTLVWGDNGAPVSKRSRSDVKKKHTHKSTGRSGPALSTRVSMHPSSSVSAFEETDQLASSEVIHEDIEILKSLQTPDTTASSWKTRQSANLERWSIERPTIVGHLLASQRLSSGLCQQCCKRAPVIHCPDCMPTPLLCSECDQSRHPPMILHNRKAMDGFLKPLPPTTCINDQGTYFNKECLLPITFPRCGCAKEMRVVAGKKIILIGINGRYDVYLPTCNCSSCGFAWTVGIGELVEGGYWPATTNFETVYTVDLFKTFEELKVTAPAMSRHAFTSMLDHRTKIFGRHGKICGEAFQRAFLEWSYAKYEIEKMSQMHHFECPACTPSMLAAAVDGNRKLYRFKSPPGPEGFFNGVFLARDKDVSDFVDYVHKSTKHNSTKGRCGTSAWTAARQSAKKSTSKIDEEGVEIVVCRHGILLKALNMFRGEIFAYPLYLQRTISTLHPEFFCSDVICKYWPYLKRVVAQCPEMANLLEMKPFLSVMHAKAHSWTCELKWGGRNQDGAGTTIGEEVEQVNSFLSRAALCTKYMTPAVRTDMLTIHAIGWNKRKKENLDRALSKRYTVTQQRIKEAAKDLKDFKQQLSLSEDTVQQWIEDVQLWTSSASEPNEMQRTIETLYLSIKQRKLQLYRQNDSNKRRHQLRRKVADEKKSLEAAILEYNAGQEHDHLPSVNDILAEDNFKWPWECEGNMRLKKKVYDMVMRLKRLREEEVIVLREVKQHCQYMASMMEILKELCAKQMDEGSSFSQYAHEGLLCVFRERLFEVQNHYLSARLNYEKVLAQTSASDTLSKDDVSNTDDDSISTSSTDDEDSE